MTSIQICRLVSVAAVCLSAAPPVQAQTRPAIPDSSNPFLGGVPQGTVTSETVTLTIADVIDRALQYNLGVLTAGESAGSAAGARRIALSAMLPNVSGSITERRQKTNLEAFGFPLRAEFPKVVGPFNVFDARLFLTQRVFDFSAMNQIEAAGHGLNAARLSYRSARDLVVLVAANLYLETRAAGARAESARAQRDTAVALYDQAVSLRSSGIVAGIDVVRAEVRLSTERQRATAAESEFQKTKLQMARVIGLPPGQPFMLSEEIPDVPVPDITLQDALDRAYRDRPDYQAALERVRAAESSRRAVLGEQLPSLRVSADYGAVGLTVGSSIPTFSVTGALDVPIFEGGRVQGRLAQADAELRTRRAEAEDMRSEIDYEVRAAFLDLKATEEELQTATRGRELAALQLTQARDRFAAGVASNIEVVQAQEAVALANEQFIAASYGYNVSKAVLARSLGTAEEAVKQYLGGTTVR